ncbi:hypothetical protein [Rhizobium bangladeshense]|nr:hypothetical protein [Rhizobium bangladeshense]
MSRTTNGDKIIPDLEWSPISIIEPFKVHDLGEVSHAFVGPPVD